ncbi:hypothetical protein AB3662_43200 [Sorangium cellulosum]|uniref:hypothetical protein n=1 Tax=Sorangium cellulosum TaxID=56 RepID=UPI003D9A5B33
MLILDANVLIDFCTTDPTLLALVEQHVGRVHIASPVLANVEQVDADLVKRLGLPVDEPPLELAAAAAARARRSPLAFDDWICVLMAQANGWTCVTNGKRLRKECEAHGLATLWGLELLVALVQEDALAHDAAAEAAWAIHRVNPRFVPQSAVERLLAKISGSRLQERGAGRGG